MPKTSKVAHGYFKKLIYNHKKILTHYLLIFAFKNNWPHEELIKIKILKNKLNRLFEIMIFLVENLRVFKLWFLKDLKLWFLLKSINHTLLVFKFMSEFV
jgi:hypothetical protein